MNKFEVTREEIRNDAKQKWEGDSGLRAEFGHSFDSYLAYRAAEESGHIKVMKDQVNA